MTVDCFSEGMLSVGQGLIDQQGLTIGYRLRGATTFTDLQAVVIVQPAEIVEEEDDRKIQRRCKLIFVEDDLAVTYEHEFQIGGLIYTVLRTGPTDAGICECEVQRTELADRSRVERKG